MVEYAQIHHSSLDEPIPQVYENQYDKIHSCLNTPFQTFAGRQLYKGFFAKASILFYLLNKNHALVNGNKRMACLTLGWFCHKNKYELKFSASSFYEVAKEVTNSDPDKMEVILKALEDTLRMCTKKI
jgi:prophage maintenance system killer protein